MKKYLSVFLGVAAVAFFAGNVIAKNSPEIPERNGVYDVPGRPDLKVRVFVHGNPGRGGGPKQSPTPQPDPGPITCEDDIDSQSVVGKTGWHLPNNWTYNLNLSSVPNSQIDLNTISQTAFSKWQAASSNKISFTKQGVTNADKQSLDGQNIIAWGRTQGTALAVTYTWYYTASGVVAETDTIFNKKFNWGWGDTQCLEGVYDAQDILTHELGHWMGLDDEYSSNFTENTMYGYGSPAEIKKDTLTTGDKAGVTAIYGN